MSDYKLANELVFWKDAITKFLREHPELVVSNTRGYFRFLENRGLISRELADKLCNYDARNALPKPEMFVRVRRELIEKHLIYIPEAQKSLLDEQAEDMRQHYGRDKKENPVWN